MEVKKKKKREKSQEKMDKDDEIWKLFIDYSRFNSYGKKGYRFGQSILTDGISVSIPLRKIKKEERKVRFIFILLLLYLCLLNS